MLPIGNEAVRVEEMVGLVSRQAGALVMSLAYAGAKFSSLLCNDEGVRKWPGDVGCTVEAVVLVSRHIVSFLVVCEVAERSLSVSVLLGAIMFSLSSSDGGALNVPGSVG